MIRVLAALLAVAAFTALAGGGCGRSQGIADEQLGSLVVEPRSSDAPIDLAKAAEDPVELGRALARPYRAVVAALGPHTAGINTSTIVDEAGTPVSTLADHATIENGEHGAFRAVYTNSADYGRETVFVPAAGGAGKVYLRPRYQRWHGRPPEAPDEPAALRDGYYGAVAATWDLVGYGAELTDRGAVQVAGRAGRKIEIKLSPAAHQAPPEVLAQRKWREGRSLEALTGEVVLDADKGVPLAITLAATVGFSREGRSFLMKVKLDTTTSGIGAPVAIAAPPDGEVVATPGRLREVDDRDFLLQGIAPPLRRNADGTAATPAPAPPAGSAAPAAKPGSAAKPGAPR